MLGLQSPGRLANIIRQVSVPYLPLSEGWAKVLMMVHASSWTAQKNLAFARLFGNHQAIVSNREGLAACRAYSPYDRLPIMLVPFMPCSPSRPVGVIHSPVTPL